MKIVELKKMIRESIQDYMRGIDEAGNLAALEAKVRKIDEEMEKRRTKIKSATSMTEIADLVDESKIKEIKKEMRALEKGKNKYLKELEKARGGKEQLDEKEDDKDEE